MRALLLGWLAMLPAVGWAKDPNASLALARQLNQAFVEAAAKVSPAVVVLDVVQKAGAPSGEADDEESPFERMPDFWRYFHKQFEHQSPETSMGEGSGVIIRADGFILTNGHVIENAESIEVRLPDGRSFKGTVRGLDPQSDVAVVKIDAKGLPVAVLGDSTKTRVGEFALAIGAPFSLENTVTFGHISAKGRSNVLQGMENAAMDQDFLQTDANINPGNSGGPLVNIEGEVIGINTLIRGLRTGIGFAIPSNLAKEVSDQLITDGKYARAWLGVGIRGLRDDPDFHGLVTGVEEGVVVQAIVPNGPASKSELKPSDIITAVDGRPVSTAQQLRAEVRGKKIGQAVTLDVYRPNSGGGGQRIKLRLEPGEWVQPAATLAGAKSNPAPELSPVALGLTVRSLTSELINQFGVEMTPGVLVVSVEKNTPADAKGIKPGDIITAINQQAVTTPSQFRDALRNADLNKGIIVNLVSGNTARFEILKASAP